MFARQTGKTFTTTLEAVLDCLEAEALGKVCKWTILSISEARAKDALDDGVKLHLRAFQMAFEEIEYDLDVNEKVFEVRFPGGSRIRAVAASPRSARGMSENLILDEFAFHQNSILIWAAVLPIISKPGLKLRIISTPNGKGNKFFEIMTSPEMAKKVSRHVIDIYEAVRQGLDRNIEELKILCNDDDIWAQEYECRFIDAASAWLTYDLINACEHELAGRPELYTGGICYMGADFGRKKDLTTLYVFEEVGDILWLRLKSELERMKWKYQKQNIARAFRDFNIVAAGMDETGLGSEPVEWAQDLFGSRVEGITFTAARKLEMGKALKDLMEDRRIRIPKDRKLRQDLHSVTKTIGPSGHPRLAAPRIEGSHADRFWACALASLVSMHGEPPDLSTLQSTGQRGDIEGDGWGKIGRLDKYGGY